MREQNIVLFSSGISENNGILSAVKSEFEKIGYHCSYWRDLFTGANNLHNIALLPILIKKIPTFDFAVLICEGHDLTQLVRGHQTKMVKTMRDNVLFEMGLSIMALGMNRVILITDGQTRLPEDLTGINNEPAVKTITYNSEDLQSYEKAAGEAAEYLNNVRYDSLSFERIRDVVKDADQFIKENQTIILPTVIGTSVSTANGYVSNFIFRTLEKCNEGVELDETGKLSFFSDEKVFMHIVLPMKYSEETPVNARTCKSRYKKGRVPSARFRPVEFRYYINGDELHIIDYPTTLVTSYQTARLILGLEADEKMDPLAEERFNAKELDLFENALNALLTESFVESSIRHFYNDDTKEEEDYLIGRLTRMLKNLSVEREDY